MLIWLLWCQLGSSVCDSKCFTHCYTCTAFSSRAAQLERATGTAIRQMNPSTGSTWAGWFASLASGMQLVQSVDLVCTCVASRPENAPANSCDPNWQCESPCVPTFFGALVMLNEALRWYFDAWGPMMMLALITTSIFAPAIYRIPMIRWVVLIGACSVLTLEYEQSQLLQEAVFFLTTYARGFANLIYQSIIEWATLFIEDTMTAVEGAAAGLVRLLPFSGFY